MFFHKKTENANKIITDALQKLDGQLNEHWEAISQKISVGHSRQEDILQNLNKIHSSITKHDMEIEDLIEALEDKQSAEELAGQQIQELRHSETRLLELFEAYQEQFFNMKRFAAAKDAAWSQQLALMEENIDHFHKLCGISTIAEECTGARVDYALHEVIEAISTPDPQLDNTIAAVYRSGYLYKGTVKRKAQVAAYRFTEQKPEIPSAGGTSEP